MALPKVNPALAGWEEFVRGAPPETLDAVLADDVVLHSPVAFTPQRGRDVVRAYLQAARDVLVGPNRERPFRYTRQAAAPDFVMLEFETSIGTTVINGVDIVRFGDDGQIVEFRVMLRPLRAIHFVHALMAVRLGLVVTATDAAEPGTSSA